MREAREYHLIELRGLFGDGAHDIGMTVAMRGHPPRRNGVENRLSVRAIQPGALGTRDVHGKRRVQVLRVRVPHVSGIVQQHEVGRKFGTGVVVSLRHELLT